LAAVALLVAGSGIVSAAQLRKRRWLKRKAAASSAKHVAAPAARSHQAKELAAPEHSKERSIAPAKLRKPAAVTTPLMPSSILVTSGFSDGRATYTESAPGAIRRRLVASASG